MRLGQTFSTIDDILAYFEGEELPAAIIPSETSLWFNWEDHSVMQFSLSDDCNYWVLDYISNEED